MLSRHTRIFALFNKRYFHTTKCNRQKRGEHPFSRTIRILTDDVKSLTSLKRYNERIENLFPKHVDVVIIGGGAVGSSVAYWLKEKTGKDAISVVVLEKDSTVSSKL